MTEHIDDVVERMWQEIYTGYIINNTSKNNNFAEVIVLAAKLADAACAEYSRRCAS
jgi:hypothetical protein